MNVKTTYFIIFLSLFASQMMACSCAVFLNFCETVGEHSIIIEGEITSKYSGLDNERFLDIKVSETILGESASEFYTIYNYNTSCDVNYDQFEIGDQLILNVTDAFLQSITANYSGITLGGCAQNYLIRENFGVFGNISDNKDFEDYNLFKENINECAEISFLDRNNNFVEQTTRIYPNPTTDNLSITSPHLVNSPHELYIYDPSGRLLSSYVNPLKDDTEINIRHFSTGVYILQLRYRNKFVVKKVIKR